MPTLQSDHVNHCSTKAKPKNETAFSTIPIEIITYSSLFVTRVTDEGESVCIKLVEECNITKALQTVWALLCHQVGEGSLHPQALL